jgi:hypothetical protein
MTHLREPLGILQVLFAIAQEFAGPDLLGDILNGLNDTNWLALIVSDSFNNRADETHFAVRPDNSIPGVNRCRYTNGL